MAELLPCPFCGGEAKTSYNIYNDFSHEQNDYIEKTSYFVACKKCGISTPFITNKEMAEEMWNERYTQTEKGGDE